MDFEINGVTYTAVRNTSNQEIIQLDNKEYKPKEYHQYLGQKLFPCHKPHQNRLGSSQKTSPDEFPPAKGIHAQSFGDSPNVSNEHNYKSLPPLANLVDDEFTRISSPQKNQNHTKIAISCWHMPFSFYDLTTASRRQRGQRILIRSARRNSFSGDTVSDSEEARF